jgi:O-acetyl-ADP-ribose deacetylase (regulator of RNase III)
LSLAVSHSLVSIAFPAISTGVFGYPRSEAAKVSSSAIMEFLEGDKTLKEVRLVFFQRRDADAFLENHEFK